MWHFILFRILWFCVPSCDHYKQRWYLGLRVRGRAGAGMLVSPLLLFCWLDIPEAEITTWLPSPLASAVLWRELWPPWTRGSLWLSGINRYQLDFLSAVDSRLGSQAGHLYLCVHCHLSIHNSLTLTCQDLMNSWCPLPLHPPSFPENFLPLIPLFSPATCTVKVGSWSECPPAAKGSEAFHPEELSFPIFLLCNSWTRHWYLSCGSLVFLIGPFQQKPTHPNNSSCHLYLPR